MDESCGHLHQIDDSRTVAAGCGRRRLSLIRNLKDSNVNGTTAAAAASRSLIDDSCDGKNGGQLRVQIVGEGDLEDELGYIDAQLNSAQPPPPLQTSLSNGSS